jgi:hypothetical protein
VQHPRQYQSQHASQPLTLVKIENYGLATPSITTHPSSANGAHHHHQHPQPLPSPHHLTTTPTSVTSPTSDYFRPGPHCANGMPSSAHDSTPASTPFGPHALQPIYEYGPSTTSAAVQAASRGPYMQTVMGWPHEPTRAQSGADGGYRQQQHRTAPHHPSNYGSGNGGSMHASPYPSSSSSSPKVGKIHDS